MSSSGNSNAAGATNGAAQSKLARSIAVLPAGTEQLGRAPGGISEVPQGAEVDLCGVGFNQRTVKICWQGRFFFAFLQDLEHPAVSGFID